MRVHKSRQETDFGMRAGIRGVLLLPGEWKKNTNSLCMDLFKSFEEICPGASCSIIPPFLIRPAFTEPRHF